ncbi:hypothetical protein Anapl_15346 [Anas platyrhynchos]|uniref:Uncharacterized protein n=1 Tax=Anas platyrhynchos TaxID=8839 RepID=R0LRK6_ANAPL|nr:hypothetical protein Anapl_15346 [Anas platyrhynchos]
MITENNSAVPDVVSGRARSHRHLGPFPTTSTQPRALGGCRSPLAPAPSCLPDSRGRTHEPGISLGNERRPRLREACLQQSSSSTLPGSVHAVAAQQDTQNPSACSARLGPGSAARCLHLPGLLQTCWKRCYLSTPKHSKETSGRAAQCSLELPPEPSRGDSGGPGVAPSDRCPTAQPSLLSLPSSWGSTLKLFSAPRSFQKANKQAALKAQRAAGARSRKLQLAAIELRAHRCEIAYKLPGVNREGAGKRGLYSPCSRRGQNWGRQGQNRGCQHHRAPEQRRTDARSPGCLEVLLNTDGQRPPQSRGTRAGRQQVLVGHLWVPTASRQPGDKACDQTFAAAPDLSQKDDLMQAFFIWPIELLESNRRCLRNAGLIQEERGRPQRDTTKQLLPLLLSSTGGRSPASSTGTALRGAHTDLESLRVREQPPQSPGKSRSNATYHTQRRLGGSQEGGCPSSPAPASALSPLPGRTAPAQPPAPLTSTERSRGSRRRRDGVIPEHTEPSPWGMALPAHPSACRNEQKSRAGKEFQLNLNKALEQATCKSEHLTSRRFYHLSFVALATRLPAVGSVSVWEDVFLQISYFIIKKINFVPDLFQVPMNNFRSLPILEIKFPGQILGREGNGKCTQRGWEDKALTACCQHLPHRPLMLDPISSSEFEAT